MTYYDILEISEKASEEVVRMAYKALARKYHTDVFNGDPQFAEFRMKQINEAYEVLSDSEKRKLYDEFLRTHNQNNQKSESTNTSPPRNKASKKNNPLEFPNCVRSTVIIAACLFLSFSQVVHPYIESDELFDYALIFGFRDLVFVSLVLMIVPICIGVFKWFYFIKDIKIVCAINSAAVFALSLVLYVTEITPAMSVGWIMGVLYYFVNKHILCQVQARKQYPPRTRFGICVIVTISILIASIVGCTNYIDNIFESNSSVENSNKVPTIGNAGGSQKELTAEEIYEIVSPSVVEITGESANSTSTGTGFFYDDKGTIITNYHVIEKCTSAKITLSSGKSYTVDKVLGYSEVKDIAILSTTCSKSVPLEIRTTAVKTGETVYAIGSSLGLTGSLSDGIISSAERVVDGHIYIQTTAPISGGNSGGPLLDSNGNVVGITTASFVDGQKSS